MTLLADQPVAGGARGSTGRPRGRRRILVAVVAVLVTASAVAGFSLSRHHAAAKPPAPTLGKALHPLTVYRALRFGVAPAEVTPTHGQLAIPAFGRPLRMSLVNSEPAFTLHVQYAHVRTVRGNWQIEFIAPEGAQYNVETTKGKFYAAVTDGKALTLFFVYGSDDGTNFAIGSGPNPMSRSQAVNLAHYLTSSVVVDA